MIIWKKNYIGKIKVTREQYYMQWGKNREKNQLDTGKSQGCLLTQRRVLKNEHPTFE